MTLDDLVKVYWEAASRERKHVKGGFPDDSAGIAAVINAVSHELLMDDREEERQAGMILSEMFGSSNKSGLTFYRMCACEGQSDLHGPGHEKSCVLFKETAQ